MTVGPARAVAVAVLVAALLGGCTDDGDSDAFCDRVGDVPPLAEVLGQLDASDPGGSRRELEAAVADFRALEADAPGAIRPDVARLREGVELVVDAVEENPEDLAAAREVITRRADELAGLAQAGEAVVTYADEECGISLEDVGGGSEPTEPSTSDGSTDTPTTAPGG